MKSIFNKLFGPITKIENESLNFDLGFWKSIAVIALWQFISLIIFFLPSLFLNPIKSTSMSLVILAIIELLTLPLIILILTKVFSKNTTIINTYKKVNKKNIFHIVLLLTSFRLLYNSLIFPILNLIPQNELLLESAEIMSNSIIYIILSVCIIAPIIEEFIFRGIILNGLLSKYSPSTSIIISSLLFALAHGNLHQGINAFLLALIFGYIFYKTRSLYLVILCHFFNNISAFIFIVPTSPIGIILNIIISCLISIFIFIYLKRNMNLNYEKQIITTMTNDENLYSNDEI